MCRSKAEGGQRCNSSRGDHRRARQRALYAARRAKEQLVLPFDMPPGAIDPTSPAAEWNAVVDAANAARQAVQAVAEWSSLCSIQGHTDRRPTVEAEQAEQAVTAAGLLLDQYIEQETDRITKQQIAERTGRLNREIDELTGDIPFAEWDERMAEARERVLDQFNLVGVEAGQGHLAWALLDLTAEQALDPVSHDPDFAVLGEHLPVLLEHLQSIRSIGAQRRRVRDLIDEREHFATEMITRTHREQTWAALAKLRTFGEPGSLRFSGSKDTGDVVAASTVYYPQDWVDASNANDGVYPLRVERRDARAHYQHTWVKQTRTKTRRWEKYQGYSFVPDGARNVEEWVDGRGNTQYTFEMERDAVVYGSDVMARIRVRGERDCTHELAHRMEDAIPALGGLEVAFLWRRTGAVNGTAPTVITQRKKTGSEVGWEDGFAAHYIGRTYGTDARFREVLSCGMEAIAHGAYGGLIGTDRWLADHDHRAFVLGCLASVTPGKEPDR